MSEPSPSPEALTAELVHLLEVTPLGNDRFEGRRKRGGTGRVFGGQVIAQALAAAELTVAAERQAHSLHAYFLRGGSEDYPIELHVERQFDGGSFSNRRVVASQQGSPILNLAASFQTHESGLEHHDPLPAVPHPDTLASIPTLLAEYGDSMPGKFRERWSRPTPLDVRPVEPHPLFGLQAGHPRLHVWFRTAGRLADDPKVHRSVLAYASDMWLLVTSTAPHGIDLRSRQMQIASLDHALWFHEDFRADEWLLFATDSPWAGNGRGFSRGRIYTADGRLVADAAQEGLIRRKPDGQSRRP